MTTTAAIRYRDLAEKAAILIDGLEIALEEHAEGARIDWEHVGDLAHVVEGLGDLVSFMGDEEA